MADPASLAEALRGRYRIEQVLEERHGLLHFLAEDLKHRRQVQIQWLAESGGSDSEAEAAGRLQHPHILAPLDAGRVEGRAFFVVPHIEGEPLAGRLARGAPLPASDIVRILIDACEALVHAHARGLVHGRLGLDSIRLSGRHAVVADFPAALARGGAADPAADVRGLGELGATLLAAEGQSAAAALSARSPDDPLARVLRRCLGQDPTVQWHTTAEVLHALEPLATPSGGSPPAASGRRRTGRGRLAGLAAGLALVLLTTAIVWPRLHHRMTRPMPPAQRQITYTGEVREGAISPDGRLLAFTSQGPDGTDQLMVQEVSGGEPLVVASGGSIYQISWSTDGGEIRYLQVTGEDISLRGVSRLGGQSRPIFSRAAYGMGLSPDGTRLALADPVSGGVHILGLTRGDSLDFRLDDVDYTWISGVYWSMAGDRIALIASRQERRRWSLVLLDPATGAHLVLLQSSRELGGVAFAPDGRSLYYHETVGGLKAVMRLGLTGDGRPDGAPQPVVTGLDPGIRRSDVLDPPTLSLSADASRMVLVRRLTRANLLRRPLLDGGTGPPVTPLTRGTAVNLLARLSPDDSLLAYVRLESGIARLMVQEIRTGETTMLGSAEDFVGLAWSPDGRTVAAIASTADSGVGLLLFPVDGGPVRRLLSGRTGSDLEWAPDGTLLVQLPGNRSFIRVYPASGDTSGVASLPPTQGWTFAPRISTQGDRLALYWNRRGSARGLWVASLAGTASRLVAEGFLLAPMRWSRDDRTIFVSEQRFSGGLLRIFAQPAAGGSARVLATLPAQQEAEDITRDGRTLIVRETEARADVWLVELPPSAR